jgi:hypothetical protein
MTITVVPAYGRDYTSEEQINEDIQKGLDFKIMDISSPWDGRYINLEDARAAGIKYLRVRYNNRTAVVVIELP